MTRTTRREFLTLLTVVPAAAAFAKEASTTHTVVGESGSAIFKLDPLPYPYEALEPVIDSETMRLHHGKHHAAYVENLNKAMAKYPSLAQKGLETLLRDLSGVPEDIRSVVRNHGGGHWNHSFFWELMTPGGLSAPTGKLLEALQSTFSSVDAMKEQFQQAGSKVFGSGWVWLVVTRDKKLAVMTTPNQDTPLAEGALPVLGNDVWEHAYYLKYQNRRAEYLKAWWNVVNWEVAERNYRRAHGLSF